MTDRPCANARGAAPAPKTSASTVRRERTPVISAKDGRAAMGRQAVRARNIGEGARIGGHIGQKQPSLDRRVEGIGVERGLRVGRAIAGGEVLFFLKTNDCAAPTAQPSSPAAGKTKIFSHLVRRRMASSWSSLEAKQRSTPS